MPIYNNVLAGSGQGAAADLGDTIEQSLRFRGSQTLTLSSTTLGNTFTLSFWIKDVQPGTANEIFRTGGATPGANLFKQTNGDIQNSQLTQIVGKFRDPSAWYHIVYKRTSSNNYEVYVNSVLRLSATDTGNVNSGDFVWGDVEMYLADARLVDGQALDPTAFGRLNVNGVWVPKNYTGSYGTNGFHLDFADGSNLGNDVSGNNNDFTASGFDTAAISSSNEDNDIDYNDTPTNNYTTLNPLQNRIISGSGLTYENANLRAQYGGGGSNPGHFTQGFRGGKFYWEATPKVQVELDIGLVSEDYDPTSDNQQFGETANGWAWRNSATSHHNGTTVDPSHTAFGVDDTVGILVDTDAGTAKIEVNGVAQSSSEFTNIPTDKLLYPALRLGGGSGDANVEFNFGQMPFVHDPGADWKNLATNNLPEPTIKNGKKYFGVLTYTAPASPSFPITIDGSGGNNGTGELDFDGEPDLVWIKMTNASEDHQLFDSVRGNTKALKSHEDGAETTRSEFDFATNGFTFSSAFSSIYQQNDSYVAWCWKAGGTAVSNTDGTITSSVSANTDAGFSIVTYSGQASDGTVGHGLSNPPEFIMIKRRNATNNWICFHTSIGNNAFLILDLDGSKGTPTGVWDTTDPGNQVFSLGGGVNETNTSGGNYVAYCWHSVEGFSKFGSYTGNATGSSPDADGPYIYLGFKPAFLLIKRHDNSFGGEWSIHDTTRSPQNPNRLVIAADLPNPEATQGGIDFLSNGFKIRDGSGWTNQSGGSYIYAAWAESPFGGENAPPATAR